MLRISKTWILALIAQLTIPIVALAQYPSDLQAQLERRAASDPELAQALQRMTDARDALTYSEEEFRDSVYVEWFQYRLSPDDSAIFRRESQGSGSINATLSSGLQWIDKDSGEATNLNYDATIKYLPQEGLAVDVTIQIDDQPASTTRYPFENLAPVTIVLQEFPDGTRHVAQFVPVIGPKQTTVDYAPDLRMSLTSAALLADDEFAGEFTVSGSIIGIISGKAGMGFEFGLKPFADASPIARTDGRSLRFDHEGRSYRLYSTQPITAIAPEATQWQVYVRAWPVDQTGATGTHSKSYDTVLILEAMEPAAR